MRSRDLHGKLCALAMESLQLLEHHLSLAHTASSFQDRAEEALVNLVLHMIHELHRTVDLRAVGPGPEASQQVRDQGLVWAHLLVHHFGHKLPSTSPVRLLARLQESTDQFVVGHSVGRVRGILAHGSDERTGLVEEVVADVRLEESVVGHHINDARLFHPLGELLGLLELSVLHTSVQCNVPGRGWKLRFSFEQGEHSIHGFLAA
mmetsp:Transcript_4620/g.10858  ORF Transcript_4620/g.10858 Transcript_4620/m.10858 type:complete len:206 (+) Transcript_4620:1282-1899(+)